jgi:hypothetical protein
MKIVLPMLGLSAALAGCIAPHQQGPVVALSPSVGAPAASPAIPAGRRIVYDAGGVFVLPDGSTVAADPSGGFTLPNGSYATPDGGGGIVLPNGSRCGPDGARGYICP